MYTRTMAALAVAVGVVAGASSSAVAQTKADEMKFDKGSPVALQGCVMPAEKKDTFIVTGVKELPVPDSPMGRFGPRYYWLDKDTKAFREHLGHQVLVTGKISDVKRSEIELKSGAMDGGMVVEIEGPGRDVVTSAANAAVTPAARANNDDIKITLLKVKVDKIEMVAGTCPATSTRQ